jgi:RHS repeat-associated protein
MKVRYTTIDGEIITENRAGVRKQYLPDPLGSTLALLDQTQTITDTFQYWPYGEIAMRSGSTQTPFQFLGTLGYFQRNNLQYYVQTRHLDTRSGRWMTEDTIGFSGGDINLYRYVENRVTSIVDPSGESGWITPACVGCAASIDYNWVPTQQHRCRQEYSHCLTCCTLAKYSGDTCAIWAQQLEIDIPPRKSDDENRGRIDACYAGIKISHDKTTTCEAGCNKAYAPPRSNRGLDKKCTTSDPSTLPPLPPLDDCSCEYGMW